MKTHYMKILGIILTILYLSSTPSFADNFNALKSFSFDKPVSIVAGNDTYIYCGTSGSGVYRIDKASDTVTNFKESDGLSSDYIFSTVTDRDGVIWFGTWKGISSYDGAAWNTYQPDCKVLSTAVDNSGTLWFGTEAKGVLSFDGTDWVQHTTVTTANGLANNTVYSIGTDENGIVWFGTYGGGISQFDGTSWNSYDILNNNVTALAVDTDGSIWFGTDRNVIAQFDGTSWKTFASTDYNIRSIEVDDNGLLWFCTYEEGVISFDGTLSNKYTTQKGLLENNVNSMIFDTDTTRWIGTQNGKVTQYEINQPPEFNPVSDISTNEDSHFSIQISASDPDEDALIYSLILSPVGMTIADTDSIIWTPDYNQAGEYDITVKAEDGKGGEVNESFTLTVIDVNRNPVITAISDRSGNESWSFSQQVSASDSDGDSLTYSLVSPPEGMTITEKGVISWTPDYNQSGDHVITVKVEDDNGGVATESFTIKVYDDNHWPEITPISNLEINENELFTQQVEATDPDDDVLTYSILYFPDGMVISETGEISWTPDYTQSGHYVISVRVNDGKMTTSESFSLAVNNVNRLPVFTTLPDTTATENVFFTMQVSANDADNDYLTYSLVSPPAGMTITGDDIYWTPDYTQAGNHVITVKAVDIYEDETTETFTLTVIDVNRVPIITAMTDTTSIENTTFSRQVEASDADSTDVLTYSLTESPPGMFISSSGVISWLPDSNQEGSHNVTVKVSDDNGGEVTENFVLNIVDNVPGFHFQLDVSNTANSTSVIIPLENVPSIDGVPLAVGDEVGVFTPRGLCAGVGKWNNSNMIISVWGDDSIEDGIRGFQSGEVFTFKLWIASTNSEHFVVVEYALTYTIDLWTYEDLSIVYVTNGWTVVDSMFGKSTTSLSIPLELGWNQISSNIIPTDSTLTTIFSPVIDDVIIVKNGKGEVFWPEFEIDQIDNWQIADGYQVKMKNDGIIIISGIDASNEDINISLSENTWHLISYLGAAGLSPDVVFAGILADLNIVKDGYGNVFWPVFNVDQINGMKIGEGYWIHNSEDATFTYTGAVPKIHIVNSDVNPEHFKPLYTTDNNATILIKAENVPSLGDSPLKPGDEIGVFTHEGLCTGAGVWANSNMAITVWGDDAVSSDINGMMSGEVYAFRMWDSHTGKEYDAVATYESGDSLYAVNSLVILKSLSGVTATAVEELRKAERVTLSQNYPNPFNSSTTIFFSLPDEHHVTLKLYNSLGEELQTLADRLYAPGNHSIVWDAHDRSSGIYFIHLEAGQFSATKRLMFIK